jgi:hypothetical protein
MGWDRIVCSFLGTGIKGSDCATARIHAWFSLIEGHIKRDVDGPFDIVLQTNDITRTYARYGTGPGFSTRVNQPGESFFFSIYYFYLCPPQQKKTTLFSALEKTTCFSLKKNTLSFLKAMTRTREENTRHGGVATVGLIHSTGG